MASVGRKPRVNLADLKKVIDMMRKAQLGEVHIEQEGLKINLKKGLDPQVVMAPMAAAPLPVAVPAAPLAPAAPAAPEAPAAPVQDGDSFPSPMVGTFYRGSSPDAAPYSKEGDTVEPGQTLCLIEAMKLMNEIKAEERGTITKILFFDFFDKSSASDRHSSSLEHARF